MREYDYDNTRDDEEARGYLPPGLRGAVGKGSPRPDEDNRLLSCLLMKPGIRITQDCADPCRDVRRNARFAHDMTNFRRDVSGKRFSTHVTGKATREDNIHAVTYRKKTPAKNRKCLFFVAGRRIELRTS